MIIPITMYIVFTVKVPQIVKILQNKSAEGISISGQLLELYAITSSVAYSYVKRFPFRWNIFFRFLFQGINISFTLRDTHKLSKLSWL